MFMPLSYGAALEAHIAAARAELAASLAVEGGFDADRHNAAVLQLNALLQLVPTPSSGTVH